MLRSIYAPPFMESTTGLCTHEEIWAAHLLVGQLMSVRLLLKHRADAGIQEIPSIHEV